MVLKAGTAEKASVLIHYTAALYSICTLDYVVWEFQQPKGSFYV